MKTAGIPRVTNQLDTRRASRRRAFSSLFIVVGFGLAAGALPMRAAAPADAPPASTPTKKAAKAPSDAELGWESMFDGTTLKGWKGSDFSGHADVKIEKGEILLPMGNDMTGITWTNPIPRYNYEVSLEAMRVDGSDFFCGLTFPVKDSPCSLILGGWGGGVVGLSSLDGMDASENESTTYMNFTNNRWYRVRLRVAQDKIQAWLDDKPIVNVSTKDRRISIRIEVEESKPFGIATWRTTGALRNIKIRRLDFPARPAADSR